MAKIALAFSIMPDSPLHTIVEWTKQAEDAGFDGVFMTEANNDSLACCLGLGFNTRRITLGTAITNIYLRHPNLLVFDEATSSLDSLTEEEITQTIREVSVRKDLITILIAHRLSTVIHADRIFVLERGKIIESGRHEELVDLKGLYYAMWRQQIGERASRSLQFASATPAGV